LYFTVVGNGIGFLPIRDIYFLNPSRLASRGG
jgi:hypothetical protein